MLHGLVIMVAVLLGVPPALAHAFLERARPAVGSQVATAPQVVAITFTEQVEPHFSRIEVRDPLGGRVDTGDLKSEGDARTLSVGLRQLPPGRYAVAWHVTSVDTHMTEGRFEFTVAP